MSQIVEIHLLQNFAPGNLNRDDTGAPKDAVFGGVRRSRISSQCVKRAVRRHFRASGLVDEAALAARTKRIPAEIERRLREIHGRSEDSAKMMKAIEVALEQIDLKVTKRSKDSPDEAGQTQYLLFLGEGEIAELAKVVDRAFDELVGGKPSKQAKADIENCIGQARAVDVALFGRMLADRKDFNVDAAAQVAHAISTHRVDREVDFFTAIDDFAPADAAASGMLGTVEFNSSCYYRYAVVNLDLLRRNLGADNNMTSDAIRAFLRGMIEAVPTGKQNSFAAHNPCTFAAVSVREGAPMNLANAFEKPVHHSESPDGLTAASVSRLQATWARYAPAFGVDASSLRAFDLTGAWSDPTAPTIDRLVDDTLKAIDAKAA